MEQIVIRVESAAGRCRISNLKPSDTLGDLKKEVQKHFDVPPSAQQLKHTPDRAIEGDHKLLSSLGISNGALIRLSANATISMKSACPSKDAAPSTVCSASSKDGGEPVKVVSDSKTVGTSSLGFHKGEKEPTFKSFDAFIKDRGCNVSDLPLRNSYKSTVLQKGAMNKVPLSVTLKHQPYRHVDHLELMNIPEIQGFVNYWRYELDMCQQRGGWMYGYYKEDSHYPLGIRAVCEAIYEPPQISDGSHVKFLDDVDMEKVEAIATALGLEKIGWIFTHLPRDELLTAQEITQIAKLQLNNVRDNHFTRYPSPKFVTCTVTLDHQTSGDPVPNAFMVSDMGMALLRDDIFEENQDDPTHMRIRGPRQGELLPQILEAGRETAKFDTDWLVVRVNESAPIKVRSFLNTSVLFPVENRALKQQPSILKAYFDSIGPISSSTGNWKRFSNFHLMLYITKLFDLDTALSVANAVANQNSVDPSLEDILKSIG